MAPANRLVATEPCADPLEPGKLLQLELSKTAKSGFKGVTKTIGKHWQARAMVGDKLMHVHSSLDPRHCAIVLALVKRQVADMVNTPEKDVLQMTYEECKEEIMSENAVECAWWARIRAAVATL